MGCFIFIFALLSPRLAIILTWIFTGVLGRAYDGWVLPTLGFFLLPWTPVKSQVAMIATRGEISAKRRMKQPTGSNPAGQITAWLGCAHELSRAARR